MDTIIDYHFYIVATLIAIMIINMFVPLLVKSSNSKRILYTRIGFFAFWALWSMSMFSGMIVYIFARKPMSAIVLAMVAVGIVLPLLDAYRAVNSGIKWKNGENEKVLSVSIVGIELLLTVLLTVSAVFL